MQKPMVHKRPTNASPHDAGKSENKKHDSERETQLPHGPLLVTG